MKISKTLVLLFFLLIIPFKGKAQLGFEFQNEGIFYYEHCEVMISGITHNPCYYTRMTVSTIGLFQNSETMLYKAIGAHSEFQLQFNDEFLTFYDLTFFYDSTNNRIMAINDLLLAQPDFTIDSLYNQAGVVYDWNQSVGDTLNSDMLKHSGWSPLVISIVDTVIYEGISRKRYICNSSLEIIEGLGMWHAVFWHHINIPYHQFKLLCAHFDGTTVYKYNLECYMGLEEIQQSVLSLYPNPAQDVVYFSLAEYPNNKEFHFQIIDYTGKIVTQGTVRQHQDIDIDGLPNGYYIMSVSVDDYVLNKPLLVSR